MANMPATCILTGKTYKKMNDRSHSNQKSSRRKKPNLQKIKIGNKTYKVSTRALRTLKKTI